MTTAVGRCEILDENIKRPIRGHVKEREIFIRLWPFVFILMFFCLKEWRNKREILFSPWKRSRYEWNFTGRQRKKLLDWKKKTIVDDSELIYGDGRASYLIATTKEIKTDDCNDGREDVLLFVNSLVIRSQPEK